MRSHESWPDCTVVVPCYNEGARFDPEPVGWLIAKAGVRVVTVDDGSTDGTADLLAELATRHPEHVTVVSLGSNLGKGEAVRRGMQVAVAGGTELVAYCDADFATPPAEVARLIDRLRGDLTLDVAMSSRVAMLGTDIRRSPVRHYCGRLFATLGSLALGVAVYDTQCGAKAFRVGPRLEQALSRPFLSRWAFDVELLGRLLPGRCIEVPVQAWHDVAGSNMTVWAGLRATADLIRIRRDLRRHAGVRDAETT
jgi:dolichyl-phosphate beta-glucosyltransferase